MSCRRGAAPPSFSCSQTRERRPLLQVALLHLAVGDAQDPRREPRRVLGAGLADGHRRDRDAGGHLDDRVERVDAAKVLRRHWHANHRQVGPRSHHARKMRGATGRRDDDLQPALTRARRPLHDTAWVAVRGADLDLVLDPQLVQDFDARLHERQIGFGAEDDAYDWLHYTASRAMSVRKKAPWNRTCRAPDSAVARASATVSPNATAVTTRPPSVTSPRSVSKRVPPWKTSTPRGMSARPRMG